MMARSTTRSNQRPDTLMQDRSPPARLNPLATHGRTIHWVKRWGNRPAAWPAQPRNLTRYATGAGGRTRTGTGLLPTDFHTNYGFRRRDCVCGLDYTFTIAFAVGAARLVSTPSPPGLGSGLPSDRVPRI